MVTQYTVKYFKLYVINSSVQIKFLASTKSLLDGTFSHHNKDLILRRQLRERRLLRRLCNNPKLIRFNKSDCAVAKWTNSPKCCFWLRLSGTSKAVILRAGALWGLSDRKACERTKGFHVARWRGYRFFFKKIFHLTEEEKGQQVCEVLIQLLIWSCECWEKR